MVNRIADFEVAEYHPDRGGREGSIPKMVPRGKISCIKLDPAAERSASAIKS